MTYKEIIELVMSMSGVVELKIYVHDSASLDKYELNVYPKRLNPLVHLLQKIEAIDIGKEIKISHNVKDIHCLRTIDEGLLINIIRDDYTNAKFTEQVLPYMNQQAT